MIVVLILFAGLPLAYGFTFGASSVQYLLYATCSAGLLGGYLLSRPIARSMRVFSLAADGLPGERYLRKIAVGLLLVMCVPAVIAVRAIARLGVDYRLLFFVEQAQLFGFARFGLLLQVFAEYGGIALLAVGLSRGDNRFWVRCTLAWAALGTVITLGRWYVFAAVLLLLLTRKRARGWRSLKQSLLLLSAGALVMLGAAVLFVCRGAECSVDPEALVAGIASGVTNYLFIPIEMVPEYVHTEGFGISLFIGFAILPIWMMGRATGLFRLDFEYDKWGLLIQDYVELPNIGFYNALVGQPLTTFVAVGYVGVMFQYLLIGGAIGLSYANSDRRHPVSTVSVVTAASSYFIPALSGPMWVSTTVMCLLFLIVLNGSAIRRQMAAAAAALA